MTKSYRILVVEDDPDDADRVRRVLTASDPSVELDLVESAEDAIAHLDGRRPDVIILDLFMPGIGGMGFLEWYSVAPGMDEIPVVVFTSSHNRALAQRCYALGAREVKVKDGTHEALAETVERVLTRWRPQRIAR